MAPEVKAHIESLQKSMGAAFTPKLEQDIITAARANAKTPKLEITHTDLNKASKPAINTMLPEPVEGGGWHLDSAQPKLQLAYNLEHEDYHKKRKAAVEEVNVKKQKLMEIQDRIRASALHQAAGDEEAPAAPEVQELKFVEPVDVASDEELFKDAEMEKHQPRPTFGRAQTSPTRRADQQLNRPRGRETSGGRLSSG